MTPREEPLATCEICGFPRSAHWGTKCQALMAGCTGYRAPAPVVPPLDAPKRYVRGEGWVDEATRFGICSRCHQHIADYRPPDGGMTAGYYIADAWTKYANAGEVIICDACMWRDARYIADYGQQHPAPVVPREATYVEGSREKLAEIMATIKPPSCLHGVPHIRAEACPECAASADSDPRNVLDFCEGAIRDAIGCEDGLDGYAGEAVLAMIRNARAYRHPAPSAASGELIALLRELEAHTPTMELNHRTRGMIDRLMMAEAAAPSAAGVSEARNAVIEECARACEAEADRTHNKGADSPLISDLERHVFFNQSASARRCAIAVRALKAAALRSSGAATKEAE